MINHPAKSLSLHIRGGRLLDPATGLDQIADLYIDAGIIVGIGTPPDGFVAGEIIPAENHLITPGLIDLSVRLPNQTTALADTSRAAALNGITTLCLSPDTQPIIDQPTVVAALKSHSAQAGHSRIVILGALTQGLQGTQLTRMAALKQAGCVGVSNGFHPVQNRHILRCALQYADTFDLPVHVIARDPALGAGVAHAGIIATQLGLTPIPISAETTVISEYLALVADTGARVHFGRLSAAQSVELIANAKSQGLPVTADVAMHQLVLTETALQSFNSQAHLYPPLRTETDRQALLAGVRAGVIDAICSDHQPHPPGAKQQPLPETAMGLSALDTFTGLGLLLVASQALDIKELLAALTINPAKILKITPCRLAVGAVADISLWAISKPWRVTAEQMHSNASNTPLLDCELPGRAAAII